jgi:hypothetical protein
MKLPAPAVATAPRAFEVAEEAALPAAEATDEAPELAAEAADEAPELAEAPAPDALEEAEEAEAPAPVALEKMVVEPVMVVKVEPPEVTAPARAEVVMAVEPDPCSRLAIASRVVLPL